MLSFCPRHGCALALLLGIGGVAAAQEGTRPVTTTSRTETKVVGPDQTSATTTTTTTTTTSVTQDKADTTGKRAGEIVSQPVRDVGLEKLKIPPAVEQAARAPYSSAGVGNCTQIRRALDELNDALGSDYDGGVIVRESKVGKLAEEGGQSIVNTLVPFRGLVREISGAAPAQRRLDAYVRAAFARRGFLHGLAAARKCRLRR
jgi:hypothetical protein